MRAGNSSSRIAPVQAFLTTETASPALLMASTAVAFGAANSQWAHAYHAIWSTPVGAGALTLSLHHWINDGLMAVFFLLVGLEIKREAASGELASLRQAALPLAGALGGIVVPALLYLLVAGGGEVARGWAIPMATDIAFAIGVFVLVAPRAPFGLRIFLTALAIVDDIASVLVIAFFYTVTIHSTALLAAAAVTGVLFALNRLGVRSLMPYLGLGLVLWVAVHASGVHATIAGIVLALTIPSEAVPRLEHALLGVSAFVVMPLFALSNAGVTLGGAAVEPVTLAIACGLLFGKPLGITAAAFAAVKLGFARLPDGVSWAAIHATSWLAGIGFTMSLFIGALAFDGTPRLDAAKVGIFGGSLLAGIVGGVLLRRSARGSDDGQR